MTIMIIATWINYPVIEILHLRTQILQLEEMRDVRSFSYPFRIDKINHQNNENHKQTLKESSY